MRKSIFLTICVIVLSFTTKVYSQNLDAAVTCPGIQTLDCTATANPLNPMPGTEYTYAVNVTPTGGKYNWFVTTDPNFITSGGLTTNIQTATGNIIFAAGTGYNDPATGGSTQAITWEAAPATGDVFLVIHYTDATSCTTDNLKVYKINILNNFAIDVYNITSAGAGNTTLGTASSNLDVCVPNVAGASYDSSTEKMVYDYGTTYLYYVIAAANFVDAWKLSFKINATLDTKQSMTVSWSNDGTTAWTNLAAAAGVYSATINGSSGFNSDDCIVVRVAIQNNGFESLATQAVELVADATYGSLKDVATNCTEAADYAKEATQTITARPTISDNTAGGTFIPKD